MNWNDFLLPYLVAPGGKLVLLIFLVCCLAVIRTAHRRNVENKWWLTVWVLSFGWTGWGLVVAWIYAMKAPLRPVRL